MEEMRLNEAPEGIKKLIDTMEYMITDEGKEKVPKAIHALIDMLLNAVGDEISALVAPYRNQGGVDAVKLPEDLVRKAFKHMQEGGQHENNTDI